MKSFKELTKNLKKDYSAFPKVKIAILGDSSTQFLHQAVKAMGYEYSLQPDIFESDFDQIEQQVFNPDSELFSFNPDFVVIHHSSFKLLSKFYKTNFGKRTQFASEHIKHVESIYLQLALHKLSQVLYFNFPEINDNVFGNYSNKTDISFIYQLRKINYELMLLCQKHKGLFISDLGLIQSQYGFNSFFEPRLYINASLTLHLDILPLIAKNTLDIIQSIRGKFNKCLIVDLDNTLWGGIIGDDGMEKIQIGDFGIGKAFTELQLWIKQLKERGIIIAVCSKNDEEKARNPFINHPDMILRLDDFAIFVANWNNKPDNIRYIQKVLNIGYDSMVFIDDNPYERDLVRTSIPEISVPELPEDPAEYLPYLRSLNLFETASFSSNDTKRTAQYQADSKRMDAQVKFTDPEEYLKSLKMQATVLPFNKFTIPRVAQLTQRSNQFNLRTKRYTEDEISKISKSETFHGSAYSLKDRFGDNGIISVIILEEKSIGLFIDTWIMSCRVLKRGVENFVLNNIVTFARQHGHDKLIGEYLPTAKNNLVSEFFNNMGFKQEGDYWIIKTKSYKMKPNNIALEKK
jgi:FkbH-like protein